MPPSKSKSKSKYSRTDPVLSAPPVFEVDTSGSAAIRHSVLYGAFASRARKGVQRTLRVDEILSETKTNGPPAVCTRVRGQTRDSSKMKFLTPAERKRLEQMVTRRRPANDLNSVDSEKRSGTAAAVKPPPAPAGDLWQANSSASAITTPLSAPQVKQPDSLRPNETIAHVAQTLPAAGLMAVPVPHPGQSYNPTLDDHQKILQTTLDKLEEEQKEVDQAVQVKERIMKALQSANAKPHWDQCQEEVGDGESDEEEPNPPAESSNLKKKTLSKQKTKAQRRRQEREKEQMRMYALRKEARRVAHTLSNELPKLVRGLNSAEREARQARAASKARRAALVAEYGIRAIRGGKPKGLQAIEDRHEYQLTEDLTNAGLRGLKPEGNLWRDWSRSNIRRGRLESRPKIGLIKGQKTRKGRMFKEVEKHAWKNFVA